jgi:Poly(3-hydroxybutyrate) depolymerase
MPILLIHGTADPKVPYEGGQANNYFLSVRDAVDAWTGWNSCPTTDGPVTSPDGKVVFEEHTGCASGSEVNLYTIVNGGHVWPHLENEGISASDIIWEFFSRHSKSD